MHRRSLRRAGALGIAAALVVGTVAFAAWSASGTGTGAGRAVTAQPLTVAAVSPGASGASLYPGGPAGWVYLTIHNPNPYGVTITNFTWGAPTSTDTANCPSTNFSIDASAPTSGFSIAVGANATSGALQIFGVVDLAHTAPDGCQGVVVNVAVTATGVQS